MVLDVTDHADTPRDNLFRTERATLVVPVGVEFVLGPEMLDPRLPPGEGATLTGAGDLAAHPRPEILHKVCSVAGGQCRAPPHLSSTYFQGSGLLDLKTSFPQAGQGKGCPTSTSLG